jgi:hypothetical protein
MSGKNPPFPRATGLTDGPATQTTGAVALYLLCVQDSQLTRWQITCRNPEELAWCARGSSAKNGNVHFSTFFLRRALANGGVAVIGHPLQHTLFMALSLQRMHLII